LLADAAPRSPPADRPRNETGDQMKSQQERRADKRSEKLLEVEKQISAGTLVVRQMTPAERKRNPPRPARPKRY
jgi:hypothetical protein